MTDLVRRSPLGSAGGRAYLEQGPSDVQIQERPFLSKLRLQILPGGGRSWEGWSLAAKCTLGDDPVVLWMSPVERLIVSAAFSCARLSEGFCRTAVVEGALVTDVSHGVVALRVGGAGAVNALAADLALDIEGDELGPGHCAQTSWAQGRVLVHRPGQARIWDLYVDRSLAPFATEWLAR